MIIFVARNKLLDGISYNSYLLCIRHGFKNRFRPVYMIGQNIWSKIFLIRDLWTFSTSVCDKTDHLMPSRVQILNICGSKSTRIPACSSFWRFALWKVSPRSHLPLSFGKATSFWWPSKDDSLEFLVSDKTKCSVKSEECNTKSEIRKSSFLEHIDKKYFASSMMQFYVF